MLPAKIPDHDPQQTHSFKGNHKNLKFSKISSEKFSRYFWVEFFQSNFQSKGCKSYIKNFYFYDLHKSRHIHHQHFVNNVVLYYMDWLNKATGSMLIEFSTLDVSGSCLAIDNPNHHDYISCTFRVQFVSRDPSIIWP